jgi:aminocarboxymuconate-semialdehyde decarboxylase
VTIDVHAHCVPTGVVEELARDGGRYGIDLVERDGKRHALIAGRVDAGPLRADFFDIDARLAAMDAQGVQVQLLSSWIDMTAYALPAEAGRRYARMFNETLAATAATQPDRFVGLATGPLQQPEDAATELRHAVVDLGFAGVEIATTADGVELDDESLDPFWATAAELRCIVLIHPYRSLAGRKVTRYFLNNLVGNPAESTVAVAHLIFGGVLERHPHLQICLVHGGGFAPYQAGRWDRGFAAKPRPAAQHLSRPPSEWLQRLYYDTVLHSSAALRHLADFVGAEHVVLGTDYPFEMGDPDPIGTVGSVADLTDTEVQLILRGNVERLLGCIRR